MKEIPIPAILLDRFRETCLQIMPVRSQKGLERVDFYTISDRTLSQITSEYPEYLGVKICFLEGNLRQIKAWYPLDKVDSQFRAYYLDEDTWVDVGGCISTIENKKIIFKRLAVTVENISNKRTQRE